MSGSRRILFDLQATQSVDQRHRGIPRYVADLAFAIEETAPEAIESYLLNPDLAIPPAHVADRLARTGKLRRLEDVDWERASLLHIASPLEMSQPGHRLLPPAARTAGLPWVVTFYDLIPHLMPEAYLEDPGLRRRYRARLHLVRNAAGVLTLSESSRVDVIEHLGLNPDRVFVVGAGTSTSFVPPPSRAAAAAEAAKAVPGLRNPYVFYIGSYEKRKNLEPLLEAWSLVPEAVRNRWQLALCCPLKPLERNHLRHRAAGLGITESVCLTGFVTDETLLLLHQGTDLFVFPSTYEGYGLPVAEALACGAPVLASNTSSLPEIVGPEALFDPTDPARMAAAIERGLTDSAFRRQLSAAAGRPPSTWAEVASDTVAAYDRILGQTSAPLRRTRRPPRRRLAVAGAFPPDGGAKAGWNRDLLEALSHRADLEIHAFADRPVAAERAVRKLHAPPGVAIHPLAALEPVEGSGGRFDEVVFLLADDECHTGALAALRKRRDGVVVAHDAYLSELYLHAHRSGALPERIGGVVRAGYGELVAAGFDADRPLDREEARRLGILFCRDVLAHCRRLLVTRPVDATLADLDALPANRAKIQLAGPQPSAVADALHDVLTRSSPT